MNRLLIGNLAGLIVAGILFIPTGPSRADDATNAAAQHTNEISIKLTAGRDHSPSDDYFGLPKEAFDRLTPEQIMQLAQDHQKTFETEQLPNTILSVLVPVALFSFIGVCVWFGINGKLKRNRQLHETLRLMIEKGQPIPPELLQSQEQSCKPKSDLRRGLIFTSVGLGVGAFLLLQHDHDWPVGLIFLLVGVAFLITWKMDANKNGQPK